VEAFQSTHGLPDVLVVERRAHERLGHYPVLAPEMARGFAALGCRVTMLTSRGWCMETTRATTYSVTRYGRIAATLDALAERLQSSRWPRGHWGGRRHRAGEMLRVAALTRAAATKARRLGRDVVVVVISDLEAPALTAALAGCGRWLVYVYYGVLPRSTTGIGAAVDRGVHRLARSAESSRRRRGGCCVVAAQSDVLREEWASVAQACGLELVVSLLAGGGKARPIADARRQLGIDASCKVALLFGSSYYERDPATVFEAFSQLDDWHLVVAGAVADDIPSTTRVLRSYRGFVDERTRDLLYSAADLAVISFHAGFFRNSGTLRDAISWGVPVVCSDQSQPAELVTEYELGTIFRAGDAASLIEAIRAAPAHVDSRNLERVRAERSSSAAAQQALDVIVSTRTARSNTAAGASDWLLRR
jgi:glycosyltransferase involved in cell wall biosynthesis